MIRNFLTETKEMLSNFGIKIQEEDDNLEHYIYQDIFVIDRNNMFSIYELINALHEENFDYDNDHINKEPTINTNLKIILPKSKICIYRTSIYLENHTKLCEFWNWRELKDYDWIGKENGIVEVLNAKRID